MTENSNRKLSIQTRVAQALHFVEAETGAVVPSIQPAATYARDENYEVRKPYWYRRDGSQTTAQAEAVIADREAAEKAALAAASSPRAEDDESLEGSGSEEGASAVKGRSAPALTFGSLAKQQTKANKKKIVANSRRKGARSPSPAAGSTGSRGSGSVINCAPVEELRRTDPEMAIVATRCQNSQGKNVECLLSLDIGRILLGEKLGRGVDSAGGWAI